MNKKQEPELWTHKTLSHTLISSNCLCVEGISHLIWNNPNLYELRPSNPVNQPPTHTVLHSTNPTYSLPPTHTHICTHTHTHTHTHNNTPASLSLAVKWDSQGWELLFVITEGDLPHTRTHTLVLSLCVTLYVETHAHTHTHTHTHTLKNETNTSFFSEGSLEWMLWDSTVSMATAAHLLPMVCVCVCVCVCARVVKCCVFLFIHAYCMRTLSICKYTIFFWTDTHCVCVCVCVCVWDMTSGQPALMDGSCGVTGGWSERTAADNNDTCRPCAHSGGNKCKQMYFCPECKDSTPERRWVSKQKQIRFEHGELACLKD